MADKTRTATESKPTKEDNGQKKTKCPMTLADFLKKAKSVKLVIDGREYEAEPKEFSTGSFGWYFNQKVKIKVGETECPVQPGVNLTLVGSKDAPRK